MARSDVVLDLERAARIGLDEAVFCASKSAEQIAGIFEQAREQQRTMLFTRLSAEKHALLPEDAQRALDFDPVSCTATLGEHALRVGPVAVALVCAGTSDVPVLREAERTLRYYGEPCSVFNDVGVAGLWRLMERIDAIRAHSVVVVAAGMDAALPSVVGGLVPGLVIALPTSVGYGIAAGGSTALNSALASCAPGVVVVNIDNGFGAACAALRTLHTWRRA